MSIRVTFDYAIERRKHVWVGALLAATKMHKYYLADRRAGHPVGPEGYAEAWFQRHMEDMEMSFEGLVMNCFVQILGQING